MTSPKQIAANQANAQKSTGPKTPEGKDRIKMNALRHGLTGQVTLLPDEDREAHDKFCAALVESLGPEGALETQFAQSVAEDNWRMNRGRAIETNIFALGSLADPALDCGHPETNAAIIAAQVFAEAPQKFQLLSLYMQRTSREMQKTLDRLMALQADRKARRQHDLEELADLLEYNEIKHLPIDQTETTGSNGFVFSINQIHGFALRKRRLTLAAAAEDKQYNRNRNQSRPVLRRAA